MKRLIIIGEGQTEQAFCKEILAPYLQEKGIILQAPTIKHSGGGIVAWHKLKDQIERHLQNEKDVVVSLFIDYYGIADRHDFPDWKKSKKIAEKNSRLDAIEEAMASSVSENLRRRFIPYLQLHEFEALLFCDQSVFRNNFSEDEIADITLLEDTISRYDCPENINDNPEFTPSTRLKKIIKGYNKVIYGSLLAKEIGLENMREKCPRFSQWIQKLETI
ncbi:MAG: DUF4276 family protein [Bacteroidia bacterium]|nr:DUF4276 family protein [Bacteroidia bacterium]